MSNGESAYNIMNQGTDGDGCLAIRGGKLVVALRNPNDAYQQWMRKEIRGKDAEGQPIFMIVNKATNQLIHHVNPPDFKPGQRHLGPVSLVPYVEDPGFDLTLFWSESKHEDKGFRYIRKVSDAQFHFTPNFQKLDDGRIVDLAMGSNHISERWKFVPLQNHKHTAAAHRNIVTISCRKNDGYNLTVIDNAIVLAPADANDRNQIWIKDHSYCNQVKDLENKRAFALVHKATGKAISHGFGVGYLAQLVPFNPDYLDGAILWTEVALDPVHRLIRKQSNVTTSLHAFYVDDPDSKKALLALRTWVGSVDQQWRFQEATWRWADAAEDTTTTPAKPTNINADANHINTNTDAKPGTWNTQGADLVLDEA